MALGTLAAELIFEIASHLEQRRDFNNFLQVSRWFYAILNHDLYQENITVHGSQALVWAAKKGRYPTAARLLSMGADPNTRHAGGKADALNIAIRCGHHEIVRLFLDHGAEVDGWLPDSQGPRRIQSLAVALFYMHQDIARTLLLYRPTMQKDIALGVAAYRGLVEPVRWLLETGVNVDTHLDWRGRTPLHYSLAVNSTQLWNEDKFQVLLLLLEKGADLGCLPSCEKRGFLGTRLQGTTHPDERVREIFKKLGCKKTCRCPTSWGASPAEFRAFHGQYIQQDVQGASLPAPNIMDHEVFPNLTLDDTLGSGPHKTVPLPADSTWSSSRAERLRHNFRQRVNSLPFPGPITGAPAPAKNTELGPYPELLPGHVVATTAGESTSLWQAFRNQPPQVEKPIPDKSSGQAAVTTRNRTSGKRRWRPLEL